MSSYTSLSRVLLPFWVQTKIEENTRSNNYLCYTKKFTFLNLVLILDLCVCSHIFKMRKALTCFVTGRTLAEFTIVVADEIPIDNSSVPIDYFTVALLKKHIWKDI